MDIKICLKTLRELVEFYESSFSASVATDDLLASRVKSFLNISPHGDKANDPIVSHFKQIITDGLSFNSNWNYTVCCLKILMDLADAMKLEEISQKTETNEDGEEASLLSIYHTHLVSKCFQFIVCLGIYPRLDRGVGIPLELRLSQAANFNCADLSKSSSRDEDLLMIVKSFKKLLSNSELSNILIKHYLCDLLAALLQLSFAPSNPSNQSSTSPTNQRRNMSSQSSSRCISPICRESRAILHELMISLPAADIMKELLCLQGRNVSREKIVEKSGKVVKLGPTPTWLRAGTGRLLTEQLLRSHGVIHLVSAFLNYSGSSNVGLSGCKELAKIVSSVPRNLSAADYWDKIAPQVRSLLDLSRHSANAWCCIQVAIDCVHKLADSSVKLVRQYFFDHYLVKFHSTLEPMPPNNYHKHGAILLSADDLEHCIHFLLHLTNTLDYSPKILSIMQSYSLPLFLLYCELMEKPFKLGRDIFDVIIWIIKNSPSSVSIDIFKAMLNLGDSDDPSLKTFSQNAAIEHVTEGLQIFYDKEAINLDYLDYKIIKIVTIKIDVVMTIITEVKESSLVGDLFVCILQEYSELIYQREEKMPFHDTSSLLKGLYVIADCSAEDRPKYIRAFCIFHLLDKMCDKVNEECIQRSDQIITFAELTLSRCHHILKNTNELETFNFESESLSLAMALLTHVLTRKKILSKEKESMTRLMPLLHELSTLHPSSEIRDMANDLKITAVTRGAILGGYEFDSKPPDSNTNTDKKVKGKLIEELPPKEDIITQECDSPPPEISKSDSYSLSDALDDLCDPEVAVRGHGFIALASIVRRHDPSVIGKEEMLYQILKENIGHSDSYVYLAAIQGCAALALWNTDKVLPLLTNMFITGRHQSNPIITQLESDCDDKQSNEADSLTTTEEQIRINEDVDYRLKIGEAIVQVSRDLGDMTPKYRDLMVSAFLKGAWSKDAFIRAASLSNLAEICKHLKYSLSSCMQDILSCCVPLLKSDSDISVRQGAALLISQTLIGCDSKSIEILGGSILRDMYQALKSRGRVEKEYSVMKQIELALVELDRIMRQLIFPSNTELKKEIRVLHPFT